MRRDYALTPAQRMDARAALALLDGTGMTLEQAARIAAEGKRALRRITVAIAADTFLRTRLDLRPRTAGWYMVQINSFTAKFGERMFDEVSRADFREWIADASLGHAARSINSSTSGGNDMDTDFWRVALFGFFITRPI